MSKTFRLLHTGRDLMQFVLEWRLGICARNSFNDARRAQTARLFGQQVSPLFGGYSITSGAGDPFTTRGPQRKHSA
jgi:hypothetical protein